jgi:prepilin-type N-terminal cleavage/methylation domain-containing protein
MLPWYSRNDFMKQSFTRSLTSRRSGFTLVELLGVLVIIGILIFMSVANVANQKQDTEDRTMIINVKALQAAMSALYNKAGADPIVNSATNEDWTTAQANADYASIYNSLTPYMAYPPPTLTGAAGYLFQGYTITFPTTIDNKTGIILMRGTTVVMDATGAEYP